MVAVQRSKGYSKARPQISKALSNLNQPFFYNSLTGELIGNIRAGKQIPKKIQGEGLTVLGFESSDKQVKVLKKDWIEHGGAMPFCGFQIFSARVIDLSTLPPPVAEAISDLMAEGGLTLDITKEI